MAARADLELLEGGKIISRSQRKSNYNSSIGGPARCPFTNDVSSRFVSLARQIPREYLDHTTFSLSMPSFTKVRKLGAEFHEVDSALNKTGVEYDIKMW
jgi:hypothetical protein